MGNIQPFMVMTLLEKAQDMEKLGHSVIHMEVGEPDFDTPSRILVAAAKGGVEGHTHYTHSLGMQELRDAIAEYKFNSRGLRVDPNREIMVTAGSSPSFFLTLGTLVNPGDEVIITNPGYPCYVNFIRFFGAVVKFVSIFEHEKYDINVDRLVECISSKTKLLILNSPANPTGQIVSRQSLQKIANLALSHDFYVISDEIYTELTYTGEKAPSIASIPEMRDRTIIFDGFSKYWAMTGWRIGYLIAPPNLLSEMNKINQNFFICAPSMSQVAAIEALKCEQETKQMLEIYSQRRTQIIKRIGEIDGMSIVAPAGAFYAFTNIKEITMDSKKFAFDLLDKAHVAATPGIAFGPNGEGFLRISYCTNSANIDEGMSRIEQYIRKI